MRPPTLRTGADDFDCPIERIHPTPQLPPTPLLLLPPISLRHAMSSTSSAPPLFATPTTTRSSSAAASASSSGNPYYGGSTFDGGNPPSIYLMCVCPCLFLASNGARSFAQGGMRGVVGNREEGRVVSRPPLAQHTPLPHSPASMTAHPCSKTLELTHICPLHVVCSCFVVIICLLLGIVRLFSALLHIVLLPMSTGLLGLVRPLHLAPAVSPSSSIGFLSFSLLRGSQADRPIWASLRLSPLSRSSSQVELSFSGVDSTALGRRQATRTPSLKTTLRSQHSTASRAGVPVGGGRTRSASGRSGWARGRTCGRLRCPLTRGKRRREEGQRSRRDR